jgi:hypothetical protein
MLKWDPGAHPRWPAGSTEGRGGEFAPKGEGGEAGASPISRSDAVDETAPNGHQRDRARPGARIQLADAGMSDAFDDPVVEAAAQAAGAASVDRKSFESSDFEFDDTPKLILAAAEGEDEETPGSVSAAIARHRKN